MTSQAQPVAALPDPGCATTLAVLSLTLQKPIKMAPAAKGSNKQTVQGLACSHIAVVADTVFAAEHPC